jgi:hypothetical protein
LKRQRARGPGLGGDRRFRNVAGHRGPQWDHRPAVQNNGGRDFPCELIPGTGFGAVEVPVETDPKRRAGRYPRCRVLVRRRSFRLRIRVFLCSSARYENNCCQYKDVTLIKSHFATADLLIGRCNRAGHFYNPLKNFPETVTRESSRFVTSGDGGAEPVCGTL